MPARRRNRAEWKTLFDAFDASEVSEAEFCTQHGISPAYFQKKRAMLRRAERVGTAFVQAQVSGGEPITVQIGEVQIRSAGPLPVAWLAELANTLRQ